MKLKALLYRSYHKIMKLYWGTRGGRRIEAFGDQFLFSADTLFPSYRKLRLPKGRYASDIVRYCDFVQMHSVCKYVSGLTDKPCIIDVGAYQGVYAVILGKVVQAKGGLLLAVEPNPEFFKVLEENVRLNGLENAVVCEQVALLDRPGYSNIVLRGSQSHISTHQSGSRVKVTTLEEMLDRYALTSVDLLLIDVEGAELPVIQGFPWKYGRPGKIFCELHPYAWKQFGYSGEDLKQFLEEHQYRCFDMYLHEHTTFGGKSYIGPTVFIPV